MRIKRELLYLCGMQRVVLIIDDDAAVRASLSLLLRRSGYEVLAATSPAEALESVGRVAPAVILMDMNFSLTTTGEEGLELLGRVRGIVPHTPVILMTAWGSIDLAVRGMKRGAFDFVTKPWDNRQLLMRVENAIEISGTKQGTLVHTDFPKIIGRSEPMKALLEQVARVAPTTASVLITGESGTGKELIAEAIHELSKRRKGPFVKVNLGGISQSLFESEMFGHKKGAFTDAYADREGRFALADGGTIFLDEIGDLDASCQVKLLRVLQDQTYEVLGDSQPKRVDVRVVSATNVDLRERVREGHFREDLFYRINLIELHLPPLRERREDIPLLVDHFVRGSERGGGVTISDEAMELLREQSYPGNIRELKNLVERIVLVSSGGVITKDEVQAQIEQAHTQSELPADGGNKTLEELERDEIIKQLELHGGNVSQAAKKLGLTRSTLYRRMRKYGI